MLTRVLLTVLPLASLACGALGGAPAGTLPQDPRARPSAREVADEPCKHGQLDGCVAECSQGDVHSCNTAGALLEFRPDEPDPSRAASYYNAACKAEYAPGCNNLAWLYLGGRGVARDAPRAMKLFIYAYDTAKLACSRGEMSDCVLAGDIVRDGMGVDQDDDEAIALYDRACIGGEATGCARKKQML